MLKYSQNKQIFGLQNVLFTYTIICILTHFPTYTFIWPYMFIVFLKIFLPTRLFGPTLILGTLEMELILLQQLRVISLSSLNSMF